MNQAGLPLAGRREWIGLVAIALPGVVTVNGPNHHFSSPFQSCW